LPQHVPRKHRAQQRNEPPEHYHEQDGRDDHVGDDNAHHPESGADDENETNDQGRRRARKRQPAELACASLNPQDVERDERESDRECVQQYELQRERVAAGLQQPGGHERRRDERQQQQNAIRAEQEQEQCAGEPLTLSVVAAVIPEPHERPVHTPSKEQLHRGFDAREQCEHPVISLGEVLDVEGKEQEVERLDGYVAGAINRQVLRELADLLKQRFRVSAASGGSGSTSPELAGGATTTDAAVEGTAGDDVSSV